MPALSAENANKVENAINPTGLVDEGIYLARLDGAVEAVAGTNSDLWVWPFTLEPDQPFAGKKIKHRTWLSDAAFWRLRETFEAFGVPTSTDTDELEGKTVRLHITLKDNYKGELDDDGLVKLVNDIKAILPAEGHTGVDEAAKKRRAASRAAALEELAANPAVDGGSSEDPLF